MLFDNFKDKPLSWYPYFPLIIQSYQNYSLIEAWYVHVWEKSNVNCVVGGNLSKWWFLIRKILYIELWQHNIEIRKILNVRNTFSTSKILHLLKCKTLFLQFQRKNLNDQPVGDIMIIFLIFLCNFVHECSGNWNSISYILLFCVYVNIQGHFRKMRFISHYLYC